LRYFAVCPSCRHTRLYLLTRRLPPRSPLFPYSTLFRSHLGALAMSIDDTGSAITSYEKTRGHDLELCVLYLAARRFDEARAALEDRKSTRLNSSHVAISYAVFCLKKKKNTINTNISYSM